MEPVGFLARSRNLVGSSSVIEGNKDIKTDFGRGLRALCIVCQSVSQKKRCN